MQKSKRKWEAITTIISAYSCCWTWLDAGCESSGKHTLQFIYLILLNIGQTNVFKWYATALRTGVVSSVEGFHILSILSMWCIFGPSMRALLAVHSILHGYTRDCLHMLVLVCIIPCTVHHAMKSTHLYELSDGFFRIFSLRMKT